ncbi:thioredoxin domain-containing protein [Corynebacterium breve]|uniref:Thioredoxin domain-containing protein n=1 Tax=Corynebacterium breve TaxID=3049799 RepID=A0ABY8VCU6_9CORY|nr:thioredoxin domain-containing protein [Corynebacterium breve]WIM67274.1 thioredoxin domain-containing protein [Corynebacterium breve]
MSKKVQNPNQSSSAGFIWAIVAVVVIAAVVIGIFVYNSRSEKAEALAENMTPVEGVAMEYNKEEGTIHLIAEDGAEDLPSGSVFEDFSCVYCAELSQATDADMLEKIQEGKLQAEIRPLNFLDRGSEGNSTKILAAALAIADSGDAEAYWNFRDTMMAQQAEVYNKWSNEEFADLAKNFGVESKTVDAIINGDYLEEAKSVGQVNYDFLDRETGSVSSPRVLVDGEDLEGEKMQNWVNETALP